MDQLSSTVDGSGPRVVLVHGFTQTLASWEPLAARLRPRWQVIRVDLPGHGGSGAVRADLPGTAALLADTGGSGGLKSEAPPQEAGDRLEPSGSPPVNEVRAAYLGYSLGGRVCLRLALDRPDLVGALVLVGASPGIADAGERAGRRAADEALAGELERDGVAAFLDRWLAGPLFATLPAERAGRAERLGNSAAGLAAALRLLGVGAQEPLWARLPELAAPVLLVAGERDGKFAALAGRMAAAIGPRARVALVPGAGHAAHLEQPERFGDLVESFLEEAHASAAW
jgi:2-succinyl-6-hydroxy-2,4-cyclohexadiene-1-carboxylate synthase